MKHKSIKHSLVCSAVVCSLLASQQAFAENNDNVNVEKVALENITVTARHRTERIIEIPMSVTSVSAMEIQDRNYIDATDLYRTIAGAALPQDQLILRGLSGGNVSDPNTTTTFVDDIPFDFTNLSDIERIEVLRGPQGTLYGSNAIGGTVRIITKKPVLDEFELFGSLQAGVEKNVDGNDSSLSLGINIPLIDNTLALRVNGNINDDNLAYVNTNTGLQSDAQDSFIRSQLLWQVNNDLDITLGFSRVEKETRGYDLGDNSKPGGKWDVKLTDNINAPYGYDVEEFYVDCDPNASRPECMGGNASLHSGGTPERYQLWEQIDPWLEESSNLYTLNINHNNVLDLASITYAGSFRRFKTKSLTNWSRLDADDLFKTWTTENDNYDKITHELRLQNIDHDAPLAWTIGAFYDEKETNYNPDSQNQYHEEGDVTSAIALYWWGSDVTELGQNTFGNPQHNYNYTYYEEYAREYSIFADIAYTFDIGAFGELEVNAGVRHYDLKDSIEDSLTGWWLYNEEDGVWPADETSFSGEEDGERYKYSLSWRPNDDLSIYALYSEGYRPGGNNGPLASACAGDPNAPSYDKRFESDAIDNYEIGIKSSVLNNKLNFSLAAYHIDWTDIKTAIYMDTCGVEYITNAGKAESQGIELESNAQLTEDLVMTFNTSYTNATIEEDNEAIGAEDGDEMTMVPDWTTYLAFDQGFSVMGKDAYIRADYTYYGEYKTHFNTRDEDKVSSYSYVNLSSRIELTNDVKLSMHLNNVFDKDAIKYQRARSRNEDNLSAQQYIDYLPERNLTVRIDFTFY